MSSDDQPRASTSKEGADPRISLATTAYHDAPAVERLPAMNPAELRSRVTGPPPRGDDANVLTESTSSLAKLQTYMPTGTWMLYTALQTWAFSLRPGDPPTSANSNCNAHQRIALFIVLGLSTLLAFISSFVKRFVYDTEGTHVLYPPPDIFSVTHYTSDPVTGVRFPCRTKENRYCWPLVSDTGEFVHDEKGERLRVMVFKLGVRVHVKRRIWWRRVWNSWFDTEEDVPEAPRLTVYPGSPNQMFVSSTFTRADVRENTIEIDDVLATAPTLRPRWTHTLVGSLGSKAYLDLRPCVWAHALVSVLAFFSLSLFSTQVCGCLYPSIPDYLPSTLQTAILILLGFVAAVVLQDDAVSLGQTPPRHLRTDDSGGEEEVPAHLRAVVEMLVWIRRQDGSGVGARKVN